MKSNWHVALDQSNPFKMLIGFHKHTEAETNSIKCRCPKGLYILERREHENDEFQLI